MNLNIVLKGFDVHISVRRQCNQMGLYVMKKTLGTGSVLRELLGNKLFSNGRRTVMPLNNASDAPTRLAAG